MANPICSLILSFFLDIGGILPSFVASALPNRLKFSSELNTEQAFEPPS